MQFSKLLTKHHTHTHNEKYIQKLNTNSEKYISNIEANLIDLKRQNEKENNSNNNNNNTNNKTQNAKICHFHFE